MSWLQRNSYIKVLLGAFLLIAIYVLITDDGETKYNQIQVQHGDSLWSLAEQYRGDMPVHEWIQAVKMENNLKGETIVAGHELTVPIPADAIYIAQDTEHLGTVKVATNNE